MTELIMLLRVLMAAAIGIVVGYERERAGKPAGMRTQLLVCMGAALFTVLGIAAFSAGDPSRMAAGIVTGIGFLGAGIIFKQEKGVVGLTTAATVWAIAAVGVACGCGLYVLAPILGLFIPVALRLIPHHKQD